MPNTQPVQPIQQPPIEDLRNCWQIAELWSQPGTSTNARARTVFEDIARLVRHAIEGLSEPSLACVEATTIMLAEWHGTPDAQRNARDTAAAILHSQVTGEIPRTWSHE